MADDAGPRELVFTNSSMASRNPSSAEGLRTGFLTYRDKKSKLTHPFDYSIIFVLKIKL